MSIKNLAIGETLVISKNKSDSTSYVLPSIEWRLMSDFEFLPDKKTGYLLFSRHRYSDGYLSVKDLNEESLEFEFKYKGAKFKNKVKKTYAPLNKMQDKIFKSIRDANEKEQKDLDKGMKKKGAMASPDQLKEWSKEYNQFPKEFHKAKGKMLFIHKHMDLDAALQGLNVITRADIVDVVNKSLLVVRSKKAVKADTYVFIGLPRLKGMGNAFVHKAENGYLYIGSMSSHLEK